MARKDMTKKSAYIAFGSTKHAALLGLQKATPEDAALTFKGWTLSDPGMWGPNATEFFLMNQLRAKVNEFSRVPSVPDDAPDMWRPSPDDAEVPMSANAQA